MPLGHLFLQVNNAGLPLVEALCGVLLKDNKHFRPSFVGIDIVVRTHNFGSL